jgi:competence protein ComEA
MPTVPTSRRLRVAWPHRIALRLLAAAAAISFAGTAPAAAPDLDVNTATQAQLEQLRGIGVAMSEKLLSERAKQPFADWADLIARVPGVSARSAARLSEQGLRVGERAYEAPPR